MVILLCSFICNTGSVAQYPFYKTVDIEEDNLTIKATVLLKDHFGFLWIGTSEGLFKYNAVFPERIQLPGSVKSHITALYEDRNGMIWAGCNNGSILTLKNQQAVLFKVQDKLPGEYITSIYEDGKGRIWFATAGEGIYCYDDKRLYNLNSNDGLSDDHVNCLYSEDGKQLIAGTDRGLSFINFAAGKKNIQIFTARNGLPDNIVTCITKGTLKNSLLVGMQSKGIILFGTAEKKVLDTTYKTGWQYGQVNAIIDLKEIFFIATDQRGIIAYDKPGSAFSANIFREQHPFKRITDLQQDNEGNIWAASEGKLLSFTGNYLRYWFAAPKINFTNVHSIFADEEKRIWFTPDLRLYMSVQDNLAGNDLRGYDITAPANHIDITSLYKDRFGFLWIGTMGEGLFRMSIETGKWRRIVENPIAYYGNILNIAGSENEVWISTLNGVARFQLKESNYDLAEKIPFINYNKRDGLGSDYVYHILIDKKGRVWFATDGAGVAVFENGIFLNFFSHKLFPSKVAYSLAEDKNQHIWVSTYNDGLFEYDGKQFIRYNTKNGLTDITITSIAADDFDNIIAVNKKGIDVFNPRKNIVQHYGSESGFTELQPNLNSITKSHDGRIWIGTNNGIVCLNTNPTLSGFVPVAVIERVSLFTKTLDTAKETEFAYNQNNLSFKLAAAYYKAVEKLKFQYWLEGYSKKWETTGDRVINFSQLRPGNYTMKVRASANENFDVSPVASYRFTINRSFWTTWWFRLLSVIAVAAIVYFFFRQRVKMVRRAEHSEREKIQLLYDALKNQVNPHFLFNSFNALLNIVEDDPKEASVMIKHLSQFYRKMTAYSLKELITLGEELELLNAYLFIQKKRYGTALQVNIDVDPVLKQSTLIPPLVLQLLAENAVKHNIINKERPLHIVLTAEDDMLVIKNNINPKLQDEQSEGVGLKNIRNRYRFLTKKIIVVTRTAKEFIVKLPLIYST